MLNVLTPEEVVNLIESEFNEIEDFFETCRPEEAAGRILGEDILAEEYVPDFARSTVDGYALKARDCFGCSEAIPAILPVCGEVQMGECGEVSLADGSCCFVPTGGAVPEGADACVMLEHVEDFGDGSVGIMRPVAPGENMIFRGDDVKPGDLILPKGRKLSASDIGALAVIGLDEIKVKKKPRVAVISTGDELVPHEEKPAPGKVRDVNSALLSGMLRAFGAEPVMVGIIKDEKILLGKALEKALEDCDAVLISGGSSVGKKDITCEIIENAGSLLMHGIAMKPGKPTLLGKHGNKPIFGLPGHPVAAYFVARLFVLPTIAKLCGQTLRRYSLTAYLSESVGANDGRAHYLAVHLENKGGRLIAHPVRTKSGLITALAGADGYFCIDRDCEGLHQDCEIQVFVNEV